MSKVRRNILLQQSIHNSCIEVQVKQHEMSKTSKIQDKKKKVKVVQQMQGPVTLTVSSTLTSYSCSACSHCSQSGVLPSS